MREFWDEQHGSGNPFWLGLSKPRDVLSQHGIPVPSNLVVLDVGVGDGSFSRLCAGLGNRVVACDVSPRALARVEDVAETFLVENLGSAPPADLGVCHLVLQHCSDRAVSDLLSRVTLSPDGFLSLQLAEAPDGIRDEETLAHVRDGLLFFRGLDEVVRLVGESPLAVESTSGPLDWNWRGDTVRWWFARCRRG